MKNTLARKIFALVLAVLLIVGTIPAFAVDEGTIIPVVVQQSYAGTAGAIGDDGYAYYKTISAAINSFGGREGKIYIKGNVYQKPEGTIENRELITIAGYGDKASGGMLAFSTGIDATSGDWAKGDLKIENILLRGASDTNGPKDAFVATGHVLTIGEGVTYDSNHIQKPNIGLSGGATKDAKVVANSGYYHYVTAVATQTADTTVNASLEVDLNAGVTVNYLGAGAGTSNGNRKYHLMNGDFTVNVNGASITILNFATNTPNSDACVAGNIIYNINSGSIANAMALIRHDTNLTNTTGYETPLRGNMALVVDGANTTKIVINAATSGGAVSLDYFKMAEGKVLIGIINNADRANSNVKFNTTANYGNATTTSVLDRFDYKIKVNGGEAHPVFIREDVNDPSSSYLKGFTFESNTPGLVPAVNGEAVPVVKGLSYEGKAVYDMSAFKCDRSITTDDKTVTTVDFIEATDFSSYLVAVDAAAESNYVDKVAGIRYFTTINEAVTALGEEGGTVYIKGAYTVTDANADFAATANIAEGKKLVLEGFEGSNDGNVINLGTSSTAISLKDCFQSDVEFKNLTINRAKEAAGSNISSNGNTITFGEGLITNIAGNAITQIENGVSNNVVINSGTYGKLFINSGLIAADANSSVNLTINGGQFTGDLNVNLHADDVYTGTTVGKSSYTNGDVTVNINGGEFGTNKITTSSGGAAYSAVRGTLRLNVYKTTSLAGVQVVGGFCNSKDSESGSKVTCYNNTVVRLDRSKAQGAIACYLSADWDRTAENGGKKYIAIAINANGTTGRYAISDSNNRFDYQIVVEGGEADAVFSGTGESATLAGFTITPSAENAGKVAVVNGTVMKPNKDGIYDLSRFEDIGRVTITFAVEVEKDYTPYIDFGNGLNNSLSKLNDSGATVNVAYMGGSITAGIGVESNVYACWRERIGAWLTSNFDANVVNHNKANSGTGTSYGIYRNYKDIISVNPDILFIEFSVNDSYDGISADTAKSQLETIIREVKSARPACDIIIVLTTDRGKVVNAMDGKLHAQAEAHEEIAKAYGLPVMYVGKALASELDPAVKNDAETLKAEWAKYSGDFCHPNAEGYDIYFKVIRTFFEKVSSGSFTAANKNVDVNNDSTIVSKTLADGNKALIMGDKTVASANANKAYTVDTANTLEGVTSTGFSFVNSAVTYSNLNYNGYLKLADGTNGTITYNFTGTHFVVIGRFLKGDKIYFSVDGGAEQTYSFGDNNRYPSKLVDGIEAGEHTVTVRFDWATLSNTDELQLYAIGYRDDSVATGYEKKEVITDSSVIAGYINGEIPVKEGYLFGGFIGEDGKALKADEIANAESLTVKFIPKAVLDIGWQIRQNGNTVDLRLISTVDSLEYSAVTFIVKVAGRDDMVLTSKKVYTSIAGYKDGENVQYAPTAFSAASEYFMTHVITGIPVGFHGTDFTVTANLLTKDGKTITGDAITFQIEDHADYTAIVE